MSEGIQWYDGTVESIQEPLPDDKMWSCTVIVRRPVAHQGTKVTGVQLPLVTGIQQRVQKGSKVTFYRDSSASAYFGQLSSDPPPISSPITHETAALALEDGEIVFDAGEIALAAGGSEASEVSSLGMIPKLGGYIWLKNTGDAFISSGNGLQKMDCSESSDAVNITGNNINIQANGNLAFTHAFNIDSDLVGLTSSSWGLMNPSTGIFANRININTAGAITIGLPDPVLDSLLSGFSYNLTPGIPGPLIVPECKIKSVDLLSEITVNPLGTSINGGLISISGAVPLTGTVATPAAKVSITSALTTITGLVDILGATGITGDVSIDGVTTIVGATTITGLTTIAGVLSLGSLAVPAVITPAPGILGAAGASMTPILVNGQPRFMLFI